MLPPDSNPFQIEEFVATHQLLKEGGVVNSMAILEVIVAIAVYGVNCLRSLATWLPTIGRALIQISKPHLPCLNPQTNLTSNQIQQQLIE